MLLLSQTEAPSNGALHCYSEVCISKKQESKENSGPALGSKQHIPVPFAQSNIIGCHSCLTLNFRSSWRSLSEMLCLSSLTTGQLK